MAWRTYLRWARTRTRLLRGISAGLLAASVVGAAAPPAQAGPGFAPAADSIVSCTQVPTHFGRMFGRAPAASWSSSDLDALSARVMAAEETDPTPEGQVDDEENAAIDAGFTYVGQFVDHDLTLDDRPNDLTTPIDPTTLLDKRTPAFDLDSVYGSGPAGSPQLYQADGVHLKLGSALTGAATDAHAVDLPRDAASGQALLGDPRNDENRIVASLHTIFLRFHNLLADRLSRQHPDWTKDRLFAEAQRQTRLHYQWAVLTDFLPNIVGQDTVNAVLPSLNARQTPPRLRFYDPCATGVPVEFSVAAYRFGHSMVRPLYRINTTVANRLPVFDGTFDPTGSLVGFQPSPANFAVDWSFFFPLDGRRVVGKPQSSYKLDNSLVFPLSLLPLPDTGTGPASLAKRNLLRSVQLGLPSGQTVAQAMGLRPLRDDQILVGKATGDPADAVAITTVSPGFAGKAPLWTYVLAEATASAYDVHDGHIDGGSRAPMRLGPVGQRIVAETFVGLMAADPSSVLFESSFRPEPDFAQNDRFGFRELIRAVISPPPPPPTPGPTPPPAPTSCSPRPPVRLTTTQSGGGRLQVTVAATTNSGQPTNTLRSIQFGRSIGAEVEVVGRPATSAPFTLDLPAGATQATFGVHRTSPGPVQVPFTVADSCGDWKTFVGGGGSAF
ncbi:MAG: heme peroxidase family protein [Chloroflexota bacterium]